MNNKMAKLLINQQLNLKNKQSKQEEQRQNHRYEGHFNGYEIDRVCGGMSKKVRGARSTNRQLQTSHGDVKYSIGNGGAEELLCMIYGHKQWCGDCLGNGWCWVWEAMGEKLGQL